MLINRAFSKMRYRLSPQNIFSYGKIKFKMIQTSEDVLNQLKSFNDLGHYKSALKLIDEFQMDKQYTIMVVKNIKKDIQIQAKLINKYKLPIGEFQDVLQKINKTCVAYYFKEYSWHQCEEILSDYKEDLLPILIEQLYLENKKNEAISIILRHDLLQNLQNQDLKTIIQEDIQGKKFTYVENKLYKEDAFIPSDWITGSNQKENFITIQELGINEDQTYFIDNDESQGFKLASEVLLTEQITGLDTEFSSPKTKLDQKKQQVEILQVSTKKQNFIFDTLNMKNSQKLKDLLISYFSNPLQVKIGHTLKEDIKLVCKCMEITNINVNSLLDVQMIFKTMNQDKAQSSLAFITQSIFDKKLSKTEQCSNWARRPLRKAQIHYATLDALICVKIYEKLSEINQEVQKSIIYCLDLLIKHYQYQSLNSKSKIYKILYLLAQLFKKNLIVQNEHN